MNSYDDWITAKELVRRIHGEDTSENADRYFKQHIASKPNFPKPSRFGKTRVWCWGEVSDYLRTEREKQGVGRPRQKTEDFA